MEDQEQQPKPYSRLIWSQLIQSYSPLRFSATPAGRCKANSSLATTTIKR